VRLPGSLPHTTTRSRTAPPAPGVRFAEALAQLRAAGAAYTQHLLDAGVITYPTTALPSRPETW